MSFLPEYTMNNINAGIRKSKAASSPQSTDPWASVFQSDAPKNIGLQTFPGADPNVQPNQQSAGGNKLGNIANKVGQGLEVAANVYNQVKNATANKVSKAIATTSAIAGFADNHNQAFRNQQRQQKLQQQSIFGSTSVLPQDNFNGSNPLMQQDDSFFLQEKGGKNTKPIIVTDPNDPRLKAYNDSLQAYNMGIDMIKQFNAAVKKGREQKTPLKNIPSNTTLVPFPNTNILPIETKHASPTGTHFGSEGSDPFLWASYSRWKKPEQPVIYQKAENKKSNNKVAYSKNIGNDIISTEYSNKYKPIIVNDPKDSRLKAYNDSLNLYNAYQFQKNNINVIPMLKEFVKHLREREPDLTVEKLDKRRRENFKKRSFDIKEFNYHSIKKDPTQKLDPMDAKHGDKKIYNYYKKLKFNEPVAIGKYSSPDLVHKYIKPIGSYFDGIAMSPVYKKPDQPYIYKNTLNIENAENNSENIVKKNITDVINITKRTGLPTADDIERAVRAKSEGKSLPTDLRYNRDQPLTEEELAAARYAELMKQGGKIMNVGGAVYDAAAFGANFIPGVGPAVSMGMGLAESMFDVTGRKKDARETAFINNKLPGALNNLSSYLPQANDGSKILSMLNPKNWGVDDYSKHKKFTSAYEQAKLDGKKEFMWNNKRYNTEYSGTPNQEVMRYGVNGKRLPKKLIKEDALLQVFPPQARYLPGHISASIYDNYASIDHRPNRNISEGLSRIRYDKGEKGKSYYVYNVDGDKFLNKVEQMEGKDTWNLVTNNCADGVCEGFGIPKSNYLINTPFTALHQIKKKHPVLDVTGRSYLDYEKFLTDVQWSNKTPLTSKVKQKLLNLYYSPEYKDRQKEVGRIIQEKLFWSDVSLPKSRTKDGKFDGILGEETLKALKEFQSGGKVIDAPHMGGIYIEYEED